MAWMVRQNGRWALVRMRIGGRSLVAGCHAAPSLTPQQAEGKHLYQVRCAHCHEDNDLALKKVPPDLHGVFDRKTLPSGVPSNGRRSAANVLAGKGMMPGFAAASQTSRWPLCWPICTPGSAEQRGLTFSVSLRSQFKAVYRFCFYRPSPAAMVLTIVPFASSSLSAHT